MKTDIAKYIKNCNKCRRNKPKAKIKEELVITPTPIKVFDIIQIDTVGQFETSTAGNKYAVTIVCELSKYVVAIPVKDKSAKSIADAMFKYFILIYGLPKLIKSDMGTEYVNSLFSNLTSLLKIEHKTSAPYHHQTIGTVERNHRELNNFLRNYLTNNYLSDWDEWLAVYCFFYNTQPNVNTGYTPFEIVFGNSPNLPEEINSELDPIYNLDDYVKLVKAKLQVAAKQTAKHLEEVKLRNKIQYDKKLNSVIIEIGDSVVIEKEGGHKLDAMYSEVHEVVEILPNHNIKIKIGNNIKTYHKNQLRKV
jgi:hypothetical protein